MIKISYRDVFAVKNTPQELEEQGWYFTARDGREKAPSGVMIDGWVEAWTQHDELAGWANYIENEDRGTVEIYAIQVFPQFQRLGIGHALYYFVGQLTEKKVVPSRELSIDSYRVWLDRLKNRPEELEKFISDRKNTQLRAPASQAFLGTPEEALKEADDFARRTKSPEAQKI